MEDPNTAISHAMEETRVREVKDFAVTFGELLLSFLDNDKNTTALKCERNLEPVLLAIGGGKMIKVKWSLKMQLVEDSQLNK